MRVKQLSPRTEATYWMWIRQFRRFVQDKALECLEDKDIKNFLTHLAVQRNVAPNTQSQAFNGLLFFYRHILGRKDPGILGTLRARKKMHLPEVFSVREVHALFDAADIKYRLMLRLIYGAGLRISVFSQTTR